MVMDSPPARPPAVRTLTGLIATDGGVAGGTRPTTALGSWAWRNDETGQEAAGYVERRPGQGVSTARAEVTAVAKVAPFAAKGAVLLIDNQAVANRVKALLAWARGGRMEATQLVQLAEAAEAQAEAEEEQDPLDQAASTAHLRAAVPALAIHIGSRWGKGRRSHWKGGYYQPGTPSNGRRLQTSRPGQAGQQGPSGSQATCWTRRTEAPT